MYVGVAQGRSERGKGEGIVKCVCVCECEYKVRVSACVCACAIEREREIGILQCFLEDERKPLKVTISLSLYFISHFSGTVSRTHAHSLFLSFNLSLSIPFSLVVFQILFFVPNLQLSEDLGIRFYKQRRRREKESSYLTQKFLSDVSSSTRFDLDFAVCEFLGERFHLRI